MTADDPAARIAAIRERWTQATPGPWTLDHHTFRDWVWSDAADAGTGGWICCDATYPDALAIAHAPEDVAYLLAEVARLGEQIAAMQALTDAEFIQPPQPGNMIIGYVRRVPERG